MTTEIIKKMLRPRSIALIGASREPKKLGHITLKNLIEGGFKGRIFPINPEAGEVLGLQVYPSVTKVPEARASECDRAFFYPSF